MVHYQENAFSRLQSNLSHKNSAQLIARGFLKPTSKHRPPIMETFIEKRIMKTNRQTSNVASERPKCTLERHFLYQFRGYQQRKMHSNGPMSPSMRDRSTQTTDQALSAPLQGETTAPFEKATLDLMLDIFELLDSVSLYLA